MASFVHRNIHLNVLVDFEIHHRHTSISTDLVLPLNLCIYMIHRVAGDLNIYCIIPKNSNTSAPTLTINSITFIIS